MDLKKLIAGIGLGVLAFNVQAGFMVEMGAALGTGSGTIEEDGYDDKDVDRDFRAFGANIYFDQVGTSTAPYRQAGFLSQLSSVTVSHGTLETEYSYNGDTWHVDRTQKNLNGRFVVSSQNLIILAGLGDLDIEDDEDNVNVDIRTLGLGTYVNSNGAITLQFTDYEYDGINDDADEIELNFRQVNSVGSRSHLAFSFSLNRYDRGDLDRSTLGGGLMWYPNQKFGVGGRLAVSFSSDDDYDSVLASFSPTITMDFTENVGIFAELTSVAESIEYDEGYNSEDEDAEYSFVGITTGVDVRF